MNLWSFYKVEYYFKDPSIADVEGAVSLRIWHLCLGEWLSLQHCCGNTSLWIQFPSTSRDAASSFTRWRLSPSSWILCAQLARTEAYNDTVLLPVYLLFRSIKEGCLPYLTKFWHNMDDLFLKSWFQDLGQNHTRPLIIISDNSHVRDNWQNG